jgi:phosphatidylserine decarboxylase
MKHTKSSPLKRRKDKSGANAEFHKVQEDILNPSLEYIASPAESRLAYHGIIGEDGYIISKHKKVVALENMIGKYADRFRDGIYLNMYLSPRYKHYFRFPYDGTVEYIQVNNGEGHPVVIGFDNVNKMLGNMLGDMRFLARAIKKNATIGMVVNSGKFSYAMIAVGSLNVNYIAVDCEVGKKYRKGDYAGHFAIGSTILLCFDKSFRRNSKLLMKDRNKKDIGEDIIKINGIYTK